MPELSSIYDSAVIQPIARIKENLSVWTKGKWLHFKIDYYEPLPAGPDTIVDLVNVAGATTIAANGTITKQTVAALQLNSNEFTHLRWEPLDPVEGLLWEQAGQQKFMAKNIHCRVDLNTRLWDPDLVTTTFWILGINRDANLEARNPIAVAQPTARFQFFGYRYLIEQYDFTGNPDKSKIEQGDKDAVHRAIGATTWVPAEGRM